ncbi:tRNA (adenine-N1)-methyltransferase [Flaviflexus salsibiostraticola]|uniref:tRNA (adenine-N1)-methyltransferase n=1 Tax=Flaviflexus salsibiostraticola TaxID=1282737 RepID=UPI001FE502A8|nr:tRNA (adenine-N1)-methyltransferase [Flaviflexus salsibiostraticola]
MTIHPSGPDRRRGPFRAGERVQLTDVKGRRYTTMLTYEGYFQSPRGRLRHTEIIGRDEGSVIDTDDGHRLLALRPLVADYVLSMPRGATPIYPKDAAQIISLADVFPGARVVEAGLGSGALTLSLLAAVGPYGHVTSVERREDFAEIAVANVESWYGDDIPPWTVHLGSLEDVMDEMPDGSVDHVLLDMLAPWENLDGAMRILRPGGVLLAYVATTTQLSRFAEEVRRTFTFTEVEASETVVRTWHLEGLSVRPDHRMVAHTGFLVTARRLAPMSEPLLEKRRPAKLAYSDTMPWEDDTLAPISEHDMSAKRLRRVLRDVRQRSRVEQSGSAHVSPSSSTGTSADTPGAGDQS